MKEQKDFFTKLQLKVILNLHLVFYERYVNHTYKRVHVIVIVLLLIMPTIIILADEVVGRSTS